MKNIVLLTVALSVLFASIAWAKRGAPEKVPPVRSGTTEFRAPHGQMGCIEAWDAQREELLWRRQIYVVKYTAGLERDVQDVFIRSIKQVGQTLLMTNERESEYQLDLATLEVKVLKGALVENVK